MALSMTLNLCLAAGLAAGWMWYFGWREPRIMPPPAQPQPPSQASQWPPLPVGGAEEEPPPEDVSAKPAGLPQAVSLATAVPDAGLAETADRELLAALPASDDIKQLELPADSPELVAASKVLEGFASARNWRERMAFVWDAGRVGPLMQRYYEERAGRDPARGALSGVGRYLINGAEILYFGYASSRPLGTLELALRKSGGGEWKLDWESYVGAGEISWQEFKMSRPVKPVLMRVFAKPSDYYNYEFLDPQRYLSVHLYDEAGNSVAHAYCEQGTPLAVFLRNDIGRSSGAVKGYTVRLAFPPDAQSNHCVWLKQVVATRWLLDP